MESIPTVIHEKIISYLPETWKRMFEIALNKRDRKHLLMVIGDVCVSMELFQLAFEKYNLPMNWPTSTFAVQHGNLSIVKYAKSIGCELNAVTCVYSSLFGKLDILKYLIRNGCEYDINNCAYAASQNGRLDILKWLHKICLKSSEQFEILFDQDTISQYAADNGHLEILKWMLSSGMSLCHNVCEIAVGNSDMEMTTWAIEKGFNYGNYCFLAVENNRIDVLKWLLENGSHWDEYARSIAISYGYDHILEWVEKNGYS